MSTEDAKTTILGQEVGTGETSTDTSEDQSGEQIVEKLVGEGKKFKDMEALAKSRIEADKFIDQLRTEKRELEALVQEMSVKDDVQKELLQSISALQTASEEPTQEDQTQEQSPHDLAAAVRKILDEDKQRATMKQAEAVAWDTLAEAVGGMETAKDRVAKYVGNDATKAEALTMLGRADPQAFAQLVTGTTGSVEGVVLDDTKSKNTTAPAMDSGDFGKMTWKQATEVRQKDPKLFYSRKFQNMLAERTAADPNFLPSARR